MDNKKIGQMFIIRMQGKSITKELEILIKDYNIGGICLYRKNYDSYEELLSLVNDIKKINNKYNNIPLFIAIDQEGGRVNRLPKEFINILPANKISKKEEYIKESGNITGELLSKLGINMNFAPVLDIKRFDDNHPIGDRCYGSNAEEVSKKGNLMMKTLKENNIISVVKHFPGHGLVKKDSHFFLPIVNKTIDDTEDIIPFKEAIKLDVDAIMVSHILLTSIDKFTPASLSKKVIKEYLRDKLNYQGLIITDDLKMKSVNLLYGYKKSSLKAINAGNDIVLIGADYNKVIDCINYIKDKLTDETIENINNSYEKIINIKNNYKINNKEKESFSIDEYNDRINKLNNNCLNKE